VSEIAPVKCLIEVFPQPGFFDDHFCKGWTVISGDKYNDGDLSYFGGNPSAAGNFEKTVPNLNTNVYTKLQVRCVDSTIRWYLGVYDGATWVNVIVKNAGETGFFEGNMPADKVISKIRVQTDSVGYDYWTCLDYIAICKSTVLTPILSGDVVDEHTITRPLLSQGINGARLTITNFNGENTGKIKPHDVIIIWLARDSVNLGDPEYKAFGGRVVNPTYFAKGQGAFFIKLDCHGHAYELINPPALLQKLYTATNGRTIIEDALALASYVTRHPINSKWFNAGGASGSTDDRINSTHDCEYDEVIPKTVIDEICDKASNPVGVKGFDIVEMPSGVLIGHLRNSLDFTSPIASITPETYSKSEDVHRVKNKIKIYGAKEKAYPSDKDAWTESLTPADGSWSAGGGTMDISFDTSAKIKGTGSIKLNVNTANYYGRAVFTFNSGKEPDCGGFRDDYANVQFQIDISTNYSGEFTLILEDDSGRWAAKELKLSLGKWILVDLPSSRKKADAWSGSQIANFNWGKIKKLIFDCHFSGTGTGAFWIDNLFFNQRHFEGSAEDATSQQNYGVRCPESEIDESLRNDAECTARATALKDFLKNPVTSLENVLVDGDYYYNPGDRQRVIVSNDNYDVYSRIVEIQHKVVGVTWDAILKLSDEPQYQEHIFKKITTNILLLKRVG
jgi:hypothetical protein